MDQLMQLLGYALIPAVLMLGAGVWATFRVPGPSLRSAILHFAGGVVMAVVAIELLPDLVHEKSALATGIGFTAGVAAMLGIGIFTQKLSQSKTENESITKKTASGSLLFATAVDISIDGLMLGIGFAAGAKEGFLLTIALAFELISLGLAVALELTQGGLSRKRAILNVGGLAFLFIASAGIGSLFLQLLTGWILVVVIAFGAAALLFLVTEELLTEAHEVTESPILTSMFFGGFLVILLLELLN